MTDDKTTQHAWTTCPVCNYRMDASTCIEGDATPKPGDFSLCINCGEMNAYDDRLQLRKITDDELLELPTDVREKLLTMEERAKHLIGAKKAVGEWIGQRKRQRR